MITHKSDIQPIDSSRIAHHLQLRRSLRRRRRQITHFQQRKAARWIKHRVADLSEWQGARRVALYLASDGEIDPSLLMRLAWHQHKQVFLPVLHPFKAGRMLFMPVSSSTTFRRNRWGIREPRLKLSACIPATMLDLVLLPLVAFDREGRRMGMGKGFYDRAFALRQSGRKKPVLIGLGHSCQEVASGEIIEAAWDVRLDKLVTPVESLRFTHDRE